MKRIYKCNDCLTIITIETDAHPLPETIICPCDTEISKIGT